MAKKKRPEGEFRLPESARRLRELAGYDPNPTREQWERESRENVQRLREFAARDR